MSKPEIVGETVAWLHELECTFRDSMKSTLFHSLPRSNEGTKKSLIFEQRACLRFPRQAHDAPGKTLAHCLAPVPCVQQISAVPGAIKTHESSIPRARVCPANFVQNVPIRFILISFVKLLFFPTSSARLHEQEIHDKALSRALSVKRQKVPKHYPPTTASALSSHHAKKHDEIKKQEKHKQPELYSPLWLWQSSTL